MERIIGTLLALAALVALSYGIGFSNEHTITVTAYGIEKITNTHGNKDGFSTDVYYLLSTDHGTYRIGIDGIYAHPEYAKSIKSDSVYEITAIGKSIPFMGIYPRVKELRKPSIIKASWK